MDRTLPRAQEIQAPFAGASIDLVHPRNVARLAVRLFDGLTCVHGLGSEERRLLWCAGLLHDVGYAIGWQGHHKHSMRLILAAEGLPLSPRDRRLVACIARYHRRADPKASHPVYGDLDPRAQDTVRRLAAILRIADGLDRGQVGRVQDVAVAARRGESVRLLVYAQGRPALELAAAEKKSALFEGVFGMTVMVEYAGPAPA